MQACQLAYIPDRLIPNGRQILETFSIGEFLYHRCKEQVKSDPFNSISLVDLSVNRSGIAENVLSIPADVLFNTNPTIEKVEEVFDLAICSMEIMELNDGKKYIKELTEPPLIEGEQSTAGQLVCIIYLKHKPDKCNYSHSSFEFYFNGEEVTFANYDTTLGRGNSPTRKLRTRCKHEISKMIIKEELKINF